VTCTGGARSLAAGFVTYLLIRFVCPDTQGQVRFFRAYMCQVYSHELAGERPWDSLKPYVSGLCAWTSRVTDISPTIPLLCTKAYVSGLCAWTSRVTGIPPTILLECTTNCRTGSASCVACWTIWSGRSAPSSDTPWVGINTGTDFVAFKRYPKLCIIILWVISIFCLSELRIRIQSRIPNRDPD
jgi:hypothetical protein